VGGSATTTIYGNGSVSTFGGGISATTGAFSATTTFPGSGIWTSSGNVGIGTTAPGNKLDVAGGIGVGASYVGTSTPSNGMIIQGNVGIGTTSPAVSLHVLSTTQGGTAFGQQFRIDGGTGAGAGLGFYTSAAGADRRNWHIGSEGVDPQGNLAIYMSTSAGGAPNTAVMLFNKDGNVGIGTASPNHPLTISSATSGGTVLGLYTSNVNQANARNWAITADQQVYGDFHIRTSTALGGNPISAGVSRLVIDNNGNVGIGEVAPGSKLSVSGGGSFGAGYDTTAAPTGGLIIEGNVGIGTVSPSSTLHVSGGFQVGASNLYVSSTSGNVGIGTTGPSFPLHIVNADGSSFRLRTGGQFDVVSTDNKAGYLYSRPSSGNFELGPVTTGAALLLQTRNGTNRGVFNDSGNVGLGGAITDASTLAGSSVVISSGNVGIGTTGPVATLEVSSALDEPMRMNHSQPGYFEINRASTAHDSLIAWSDLDVRKWYLGQRSTDGDTSFHLFSTAKTGGAGDVMTVLNTGNVGIGTTTPAYTLSVVGNVQFATLATTTATNYLTTDSTGKLVLASGASAGVSSWGGSASSTQTYATGTATGIGLNITTANGVHTWTPTVTSGYEIPTTASTSAWNTAGAGSTVFFTRQGNWNVTSFDVRYMSPLGAYTGESQVWFITAKGGTIKNLYIRAVSHSMNNGTKFRVRVNGVDTNINVDLATSVLTGNDTVNTASVSAGDYITVKIDTASSSSGSIGNPTAAFEIAF